MPEELDRRGFGERVEGVFLLVRDAEGLSARRQDTHVRARAEQESEVASSRDDLLEVVDHQQRRGVPEVVSQIAVGLDRLGDRRSDECRIPDRRQVDEPDAVREAIGHFGRRREREPRLPNAAGTRDRDKPGTVLEHVTDIEHLLLPSHERVRRNREVGSEEALQRRETLSVELKDALRSREVLEAVLAKIDELEVLIEECSGRRREHDLAAVRGRGDAGSPVNVVPDISLLRKERRTGVDARPNPHGPATSASLNALAAPSAPGAVGNAKKNASPCVSTSTPPQRTHACLTRRRCSASADAYSSSPSSWSSFVEPSTSVKTKVTVPDGSPSRTTRSCGGLKLESSRARALGQGARRSSL